MSVETIKAHVPSLSTANEEEILNTIERQLATPPGWPDLDVADFAVRTCSCGVRIDGYYQYVDHLITVFGGESHLGG